MMRIFINKDNYSYLLTIIAIVVLSLYNLTPRIDGFDTTYYYLAGEHILNGHMDCLRTPIYPLLLESFSLLFGNVGGTTGIIILQSIVYLFSVFSLEYIARRIINNHYIQYGVIFLYIICVAPGWCNELMPESLSISCCVIMINWLFKYIVKPSWRLIVSIFLLTLFLIFLKPSFIFLFTILPFVWIVMLLKRKEKLMHSISFLLTIVCIICYLGYCNEYKKEYGVFASSMNLTCDVYILKSSDSWNLEKITNPQAKQLFLQIDNQWQGNYGTLYNLISQDSKKLQLIAQGCKEMKQGSQEKIHRSRIEIIVNSFNKRFNASVNTQTPLSVILFFSSLYFALPLSFFYTVVLVSCLALLLYIILRHRIPLMASILILFITAQCLGILIFASEAHERLLLPVYPIFLILLGIIVEKITQLLKQQ